MAQTNRRAQRRRLITPDDLTRIVFVGDPQVSPDGAHVLFTRKHVGDKNDYVTNLWRVPVAGGDPAPFTSGGKDGHGRWSPDGSRIAFIRGGEGGSQIHVIPARGGEATKLTGFPEGAVAAFKWSPDGRRLAVSFREQDPDWTTDAQKERKEKGGTTPPRVLDNLWYRLDGDGYFNNQRFRLYLVDAGTGEHREIFHDTLGGFSFDWSPDSRQLAVTANRDRRALERPWKDGIYRVNAASGKVVQVRLPDGPKAAVAWSPDGKHLAYAGREGKDDIYSTENLGLWVCDPVKGNARCLTAKEDYCLLAIALSDTSEAVFGPTLRWSGDGKRVVLLLGWHGEAHVASVPASGGKIAFHTSGAFDHALGNVSADGKRWALTGGHSVKLPEVHVGELSGGRLRLRALTDFNRDLLAGLELSKPRSHWVTAADGARVQVWALMPPRKKGKVPGVLQVHGGPHAQYGVGFFHEMQVLAAAGYAVFYSNPRGSKGYGRDFCHAIRGAWGGADWVDVQAVRDFMKAHPRVNPKKLGIMGGSYGGYMTNWAIGHTHDFAGAVTDRCVANLVSMGGSSDFPLVPDTYWPGNFWDRTDALWDQSPIHHMGKVKTPTLIIHSEGDLRCNIEQGEQVFTLLQLKGVPSRFVRYPRETSHGMSRGGPPDMRLHRLGQILQWWKKYLG